MPTTAPEDQLLGPRLRDRREELGLSTRELGEKVGVSHTSIRNWEANAPMRVNHFDQLAKAVGWDIDVMWPVYTATLRHSLIPGYLNARAIVCRLARFVPSPVLSPAAA